MLDNSISFLKNRKHGIKQFILFGIIGFVNTVLSLVIYWICVGIGIHYFLANAIAFIITVAISYVLNNVITFKSSSESAHFSVEKMIKVYASYFFTGIVLSSILLYFYNDIVGININLSPVINLFITVPTNFLLNKYWVYKSKPCKVSSNGSCSER